MMMRYQTNTLTLVTLFFNLNPVEVNVENDSIDFEMRMSRRHPGHHQRDWNQRKYQNERACCAALNFILVPDNFSVKIKHYPFSSGIVPDGALQP